jgi:hypothetical protein
MSKVVNSLLRARLDASHPSSSLLSVEIDAENLLSLRHRPNSYSLLGYTVSLYYQSFIHHHSRSP